MRLLRREALENSALAVVLCAVLLVLAAGAESQVADMRLRLLEVEERVSRLDRPTPQAPLPSIVWKPGVDVAPVDTRDPWLRTLNARFKKWHY